MKFLLIAISTFLSPIVSRLPRRDASTILMLGAASASAFFLLALRIVVSRRIEHLYLPWNLFLAWLPVVFSIASLRLGERFGWRHWKPWLAATAWLLFFPNAPYLFTDLVHLGPVHNTRFWIDMILILLFAWPGFLLGCVSLRMMHQHVARTVNHLVGWIFASMACGLAGFGVYIGRFQRWNSWDIVANPIDLAMDLFRLLALPPTHPFHRLTLLFGALIFIGYMTVQVQSRGTVRWPGASTRSGR